jgi:diguanylate cyclase (GGDEF)-like protein
MGGDEFVALIFGHTDRQALDDLTARLQAALSAPLDVAGNQWRVTASIGVVQVDPKRPRTAAEILRDADAAMYRAKARRAATHYADDTPATAYG